MRFDPEYVAQVLTANFEDAKTLFLGPLLAVHEAHLVMLADRGLLEPSAARTLRTALSGGIPARVAEARYDGSFEDLFFFVERLLVDACGSDIAGRLHLARSRNDIDMTMYRMRLRQYLADTLAVTLVLRDGLLELASRHRDTVFAAHTHTQPAQPTTIAHYLLAVVEQLERDARRMQAAFRTTNRNPLGSCAITGTGFPIDRTLTADLLGFDEPTGNTYGSIATVDYVLESTGAISVLLVGLGRVAQDLLLWCTAEFGYLRLADGFVQSSSIMPQKRNPVALEHARALASKALGQAAAVTFCVHNTPFGDIVDTEDDLQPLIAAAFHDAQRTVALIAAALRAAEFDVERLRARAAVGGTTATELADHLVRQHGLPFAAAHGIAAGVLAAARIDPSRPLPDIVAEVTAERLGSPLGLPADELARVTSAPHFVGVRTTWGGPAPAETARAIDTARDALQRDRQWLDVTRAGLAAADARRTQRLQEL